MKTKWPVLIFFLAVMVFALACTSDSTKTKRSSEIQKADTEVYYTCTMHPEVRSDKPGKCPICGMELVKKEMKVSDTAKVITPSDTMKVR